MSVTAVFLALAVFQAAHDPAPAASPAVEHAAPAADHAAPAGEHGESAADILMHHVTDQPYAPLGISLGPSKHLVFFVLVALVVILVAQLARRSYRAGGVPKGIAAAVETMVLFVRDEIAEKNIGHDGRRFTPLLLSFFFFILLAALIGLTPFSATSTGNINVTAALALVSFGAQQWAGIRKFGVLHHFTGMVPPGMPWPLLPIMVLVEFIGMLAKPFALLIRLFANMLAGHMVITTLLLLIPLAARITPAAGFMMMPVSIGLALFIMFLEVLVAFIQAYIFTLLTSIFIGMYAHPAH